MKTEKKTRFSSCLEIELPKAWSELTQEQLRYIYLLQSQGQQMDVIRIMFMLRMMGIQPIRELDDKDWLVFVGREQFRISKMQLAVSAEALDWMSEPPKEPICLTQMDGVSSVDPYFQGVPFGQYLMLDNYYQGYLIAHEDSDMMAMAQILYPGYNEMPNLTEQIAIISRIVSLKSFFAKKWPDLFSQTDNNVVSDQESLMNAMIRALTGGDVLKENQVLERVDTWRALTELNEKAKEAKQIKTAMK